MALICIYFVHFATRVHWVFGGFFCESESPRFIVCLVFLTFKVTVFLFFIYFFYKFSKCLSSFFQNSNFNFWIFNISFKVKVFNFEFKTIVNGFFFPFKIIFRFFIHFKRILIWPHRVDLVLLQVQHPGHLHAFMSASSADLISAAQQSSRAALMFLTGTKRAFFFSSS